MKQKNLIMGVVNHYWWYQMEPFFVSCSIHNSQDCDIIIFVKDISVYARDKLGEYHVRAVDIPDDRENGCPNDRRYGLYYEILKAIGQIYEQVLLSDTRDVFFQAPMFSGTLSEPYLGVAVESSRIAESGWNRRWMQERFGMNVYDKVKDKNVLCSGTIWGSTDVILELCKAMVENLSDSHFSLTDINDQATYQYLLYNGIIPSRGTVSFCTLMGGRVATIGLKGDYSKDRDSIFSPAGGNNRPALVHQWDRHKELYPFVREHYREKHAKIRWKRYLNDYLSLKDIALSSYYGKHFVNMFIASFLYLIARKPKGDRLWRK